MSANSSNYSNTLEGGDAEAGRRVVFGHPAAQCIRCHKVAGLGSEVGPDLSKVGSKLSREQIMESLVNPQAKLTEGYGLLVARLKNGSSVNGAIVKATESKYEIRTAEGTLKMISRKDIASEVLTSQMPPMGAILTRNELRDVLEFLGRLK